MRKFHLVTLTGALFVFGLLSPRGSAQLLNPTDLVHPKNPAGPPLSCTFETNIHVPLQLLERARLKARLAVLLRESLDDDARGIFNVEREKEIKKLANQVRNLRD